MRSKIAQKILNETPKEVEVYVRLYGHIAVRISDLIAKKGITQKSLAESLGKKPSEISRWLSGDHNFTLRSLAKLEAELGEMIINVPKRQPFRAMKGEQISMTVYSNLRNVKNSNFLKGKTKPVKRKIQIA